VGLQTWNEGKYSELTDGGSGAGDTISGLGSKGSGSSLEDLGRCVEEWGSNPDPEASSVIAGSGDAGNGGLTTKSRLGECRSG